MIKTVTIWTIIILSSLASLSECRRFTVKTSNAEAPNNKFRALATQIGHRDKRASNYTTDVPEEVELEEGATSKDGLLLPTPAEDPVEQHDRSSTTSQSQSYNTRTTVYTTQQVTSEPPEEIEPEDKVTAKSSSAPQGGVTRQAPTEEPEEIEAEDIVTGKPGPPKQAGTTRQATEATEGPEEIEAEDRVTTVRPTATMCPVFRESIMEHHVILRKDGCEIFISQDDSVREFGYPGESPPAVYVRHYSQ